MITRAAIAKIQQKLIFRVKMGKFLLFLNNLVNFYLYFTVMACFLSLIPYINPDYPMFHVIFTAAGFYIVPPFAGFAFGPAVMLTALVLISTGLNKLYEKYFMPEQPKIVVLTPEQFINAMQNKDEFIKSLEESEDKKE